MIAGLIPFNEGNVLIDGTDIYFGEKLPRNVGYVFQKDTVFPWRTVRKNIGYGLEPVSYTHLTLPTIYSV